MDEQGTRAALGMGSGCCSLARPPKRDSWELVFWSLVTSKGAAEGTLELVHISRSTCLGSHFPSGWDQSSLGACNGLPEIGCWWLRGKGKVCTAKSVTPFPHTSESMMGCKYCYMEMLSH